MALSQADLDQARVNILGTTVDAPGAAWTAVPPAAANTLNTSIRIVTRLLNAIDERLTGAVGGTNGFADKFTAVVGDDVVADKDAFDSIGMNLIQAVAALIAGGARQLIELEFVFSDPLTTSDFVEVTVTADCTIAADLEETEYTGTPETADMLFELTEQPSGDVIGQVLVEPGNVITLSGIGGEVTAGTVLRMTAEGIVGGPVSPGAVITVVATRKPAEFTGGRYIHEQTTAANSWTITHSLGFAYVQPQVVRDNGAVMLPNITYLSNDQCRLDFAQAVSGTAILRR